MALWLRARVEVTAVVTGTGPLTAIVANSSRIDFSVMPDGDYTYGYIQQGALWEECTLTKSGATMVRSLVTASSSGGSSVAFDGATSVTAFIDVPLSFLLVKNAAGGFDNADPLLATVAVNTIVALKAVQIPATSGLVRYVRGNASATDGKGGWYYWDSADATAGDDYNFVVSNNSASGRWIRVRQHLDPASAANDAAISSGAIARVTGNLRSKHATQGGLAIPETVSFLRAIFDSYAEFKALASTTWANNDRVAFNGITAKRDAPYHEAVWNAASTNTDSLDRLFIRPNDITGINPGRAQFVNPAPIAVFADADPTPSVKTARHFRASNLGTTVTALDDAIDLQVYTIFPGLADTQFTHSATFVMPGATNFVLQTSANGGAPVQVIYENGVAYLMGGGGGVKDALAFKGVINASTNPNYPAANAGDVYKISVAGKIGGAAGPSVEINDQLLCTLDGSAAGDHATVGANWSITQTNIDGAVVGPVSAVDSRIAALDGPSGKLIKDGGKTIAELASLASLASTAAGQGAGLVGVQDAAGNFAATTVEAALAELGKLKQEIFKPENFAGATEADRWTAMVAGINAASPKAAKIVLAPGKVYTGVIPSATFAGHVLNDLLYLEIDGNGATLADNIAYLSGQQPKFINAERARNVVLRNLKLTSQENAFGLENDSGPYWVFLKDQSKFIIVENVTMHGGWTCVYLSHNDPIGTDKEPSHLIFRNYETRKVGRPIITFFEGAFVHGENCDFDGSGRDFFLNNPVGVDLEYRTRNSSSSALLIAQGAPEADKKLASAISIKVRTRSRTEVVAGAALINFIARTDPATALPVRFNNIDLDFDADLENGKVGGVFILSSQTSVDGSGVTATRGYGHVLDGLRISGSVRNVSSGANIIDFDSQGAGFNANITPDVIKNVVFRDLVVDRASGAAAAPNFVLPIDINENRYVFIACDCDCTINGAAPAAGADFTFIASSGSLPSNTAGVLHTGGEATVAPAKTDKVLALDASNADTAVFLSAEQIGSVSRALSAKGSVFFNLDASKNDWNPTDQDGSGLTFRQAGVLRIGNSTSGAFTITGLEAPQGDEPNIKIVRHVNGGDITIAHNNAGSLAANQIFLPASRNLLMQANDAVAIYHDGSAWRVFATSLQESRETALSFTPQLRDDVGAQPTYTTQQGNVHGTGNGLNVMVRIAWSAITGLSGGVDLHNWAAVVGTNTAAMPGVAPAFVTPRVGFTFGIAAEYEPAGNQVTFRKFTAGAWSVLTWADMPASGEMLVGFPLAGTF